MDIIYNLLPKDLAYIVDDFAKDKTIYNSVMQEFIQISKWFCNDSSYTHKPYVNYLNHFKYQKEQRFNKWYCDIKQLKKPHGKQSPTLKSRKYLRRQCPRRGLQRKRCSLSDMYISLKKLAIKYLSDNQVKEKTIKLNKREKKLNRCLEMKKYKCVNYSYKKPKYII